MKQILVVDNHPVMCKFMSGFLAGKGNEVVTAASGLSALNILESYTPDVIFIDLVMPNISGDKLCSAIRGRKNLNRCFIVVLSAIAAEEEISPEDLGADVILAKSPFDKLSGQIDLIMQHVQTGRTDLLKGSVIGTEELFERQITKELLASKKHNETTLNNMSEGLVELSDDGKIIYANPAAISIIEIKEENLLSADFAKLFTSTYQVLIRNRISQSHRTGLETPLDEALELNNKLVLIKIIPIRDKNIQPTTLVMLSDVTLQRKTENELLERERQYLQERNFLDNMFENSPDAIAIVDAHGRFTRWNNKAALLFGYTFTELKGKKAFELYADTMEMEAMLDILRRQRCIQNYEIEFARKDGTTIPCAVSISLLHNEKQEKVGSLSIIRDLSEWKLIEQRLTYLSFHDSLTGLYNRAFFEEEMKRLAAGRHLSMGIIVCDINWLKLVNDTMGHQKGDELIKATADILTRSFRHGDIIARIGGDEFAVLLPQSNEETVKNRVKRIKSEIKDYNKEQSPEQQLSISIGYGVSDDSPVNMQALFKNADDHMYLEKLKQSQAGGGRILHTLIEAFSTRDGTRREKTERILQYAEKLADSFGLSEKRLGNLQLLVRFHDLGNGDIIIPESVLCGQKHLTSRQFREISQHCETGRKIAMSTPYLSPVAGLIYKHHEWWNGSGCPGELKGNEIPIECRILAVVEAYVAITGKNNKNPVPPREAVEKLKQGAGTRFDPEIVQKFLHILEKTGELQ